MHEREREMWKEEVWEGVREWHGNREGEIWVDKRG